jgi:hypothetical protein
MVTIITRQEIAYKKPVIGTQIAKMQRSFFDEEMLQWYKDEGNEAAYYAMYDLLLHPQVSVAASVSIIGVQAVAQSEFVAQLAIRLERLFEALQVEELILMSHLGLDLFGNRENDYEPLQQAYATMEALLGSSSFSEALVLQRQDLKNWVPVLFWIIRCDPSVPEYIFLYDAQERIECFICKYGNVHITEIGEERITPALLDSLGWELIDGPEYDRFSDDGAIEGRQILLED